MRWCNKRNRYARDVIDRLLAKADIEKIVRSYLGDKLRQRGQNTSEFVTRCPFHNERTPSFTVTSSKQFYHCFGCGAHGDAIGFIKEAEHLEYHEAVVRLAEKVGFKLPFGKTNASRARRRSRDATRMIKKKQRQDAVRKKEIKKHERQSQSEHRGRKRDRFVQSDNIPF